MPENHLMVEGMDCPACAAKIETAVKKMPGVDTVVVDYLQRSLKVTGENLSNERIQAKVESLGYHVAQPETTVKSDSSAVGLISSEQKREFLLLCLGAVLVAAGGIGRALNWPQFLPIALIVLGALPGYTIFKRGLAAAMRFDLNMNFLMSAAAIGAAALGEWTEAGVIVILYAGSELVEAISVERSRQAVKSLLNLAPKTAFLIKNGIAVQVPAHSLTKGDVVLVKPGSILPVDGKVISGITTVDQSSLTGESLPLDKIAGDKVFAGSINGSGAIRIETEHAPGDTTLDRVIKLVAEAQSSRTPLQTSIERFAKYYTPAVVILAAIIAVVPPLLMGGLWATWIYRSLTLLMIACPCALVLASPVTLVSALATAARNGVLVKGGRYMEGLGGITVVALDKTGTITEGHPAVDRVHLLDGLPPSEMIRLAASVELHSEHPIAQAVVKRASDEGLDLLTPELFHAIPGRGAEALIAGQTVFVGNHALFEERDLCDARIHTVLSEVEEASHTAMLIGTKDGLLGLMSIADKIRSDSAPAIKALRDAGVKRVVLLTGDNHRTGNAVGRVVDADEVRSELLPEGKILAVRELRDHYGSVVMVGDGVNDAPALAAADIGIGIGGTGADAALETSDIVLMGGGIKRLPWLFKLSQRARRIVRANIALAIGIKALFLALAIAGKATLWMALLADTGVALLVVANGLRMLRQKGVT